MKTTTDDRSRRWGEYYDANAQKSDWVKAHGWGYSAEVAENTLVDIRAKLRLEPQHQILEVGCGCGMVLNVLLARGQTGWGIEQCQSLIDSAPRFGVDLKRIRLLQGEASSLAVPDAKFDRVLCYSVFMYFPSEQYAVSAVQELIRVCRPGGSILVGDICGYWEAVQTEWKWQGFSRETVCALLALPCLRPVRVLLWPVRVMVRALRRKTAPEEAKDGKPPDYRQYTHRFFRRIARRNGCRIEFLTQSIPGRERISSMRFDVRITKI